MTIELCKLVFEEISNSVFTYLLEIKVQCTPYFLKFNKNYYFLYLLIISTIINYLLF